ncbi:MAG: mannose-6-phosphate isomerase, class I [Termitinemataceae bacterium]|nr:MAG: mannose-6-phosphate isomerase, class I [Termitinemataceae bacterium]
MHILSTIVHKTIWGGEKFARYVQSGGRQIGHLYSLITEEKMSSVIVNGVYQGMQFKDYFTQNKERLHLGRYDEFPFVIALVDAKDDLSIQVHPDAVIAQKLENRKTGKNESWYFLEAPEGRYIYNGCKCQTTDEVRLAVEDGKIMDIIGRLKVEKGDYVFVESGTLHACTAGSLIYEIEENCNITYRFYDYNRTDASGNKRSLQIKNALLSLKTDKKSKVQKYSDVPIEEFLYSTQFYKGAGEYINKSSTLECLTLLEIGGDVTVDGIVVLPGTTVVLEPKEVFNCSNAEFIVARPRCTDGY